MIEVYKKMALIRCFEQAVIEAVQAKRIRYACYLALGGESVPAAAARVLPEFHVATQHRCHGVYLAWGGDPARLRDELLGKPTGTSQGRAGSNCIQNHDQFHMWGHHGLIGENVPLAVGLSMGLQQPVVAFFGDGAAEEDYVLPAIGFAHKHHLPVLFVCEDNNLSILTPVKDRRSWRLPNISKAMGLPSLDIIDATPEILVERFQELKRQLPALVNVHVQRERWHVGVGTDGGPVGQIFGEFRQRLAHGFNLDEIDAEIQTQITDLWKI